MLDVLNISYFTDRICVPDIFRGFFYFLKQLNPNLNVNNKNCEGLTPLLLVTRDLDLFDASK